LPRQAKKASSRNGIGDEKGTMTMTDSHTKPHEEHSPADGASPTTPGGCTATTQYGRPCQNPAQPGKEVCWSHDPENAAQRVSNARAGGIAVHSPATREIGELKDELKALIRGVKEGKVAPGVAAVITQLANTIIRAIDQDRKVRELDDIEERLAELERRAEDGTVRREAA
jgi:hypothetical protein